MAERLGDIREFCPPGCTLTGFDDLVIDPAAVVCIKNATAGVKVWLAGASDPLRITVSCADPRRNARREFLLALKAAANVR